MTRIACVLMHKRHPLLMRPWLIYHGYLFGFENLHVYAVDSAEPELRATLAEFAAIGVKTGRGDATGASTDLLALALDLVRPGGGYDLAVPLDGDEFIAINGATGPACERTPILEELVALHAAGETAFANRCLESYPGYLDLFRYVGGHGALVAGSREDGPENGTGQLGAADDAGSGVKRLIYLHLIVAPAQGQEAATWDAEPLIRFRGLARVLGVLMGFDAIRLGWENGRTQDLPPGEIVWDLDADPFDPQEYWAANPGLQGEVFDPFEHFVWAGYREGAYLYSSEAGARELVRRMAAKRAIRHDGVSGYVGLVRALSGGEQSADADRILGEALEEFGPTIPLLRELALAAMYGEDQQLACERWARFRALYPDEPDGYDLGAFAHIKAADMAAAERVVRDGLERFPDHVGLSLRLIELAIEARDWRQVRSRWSALVRAAPNDDAVKQQAGFIVFQIQNWEMAQLDAAPVQALDGPVFVAMSERQTNETLRFLGLDSIEELRAFFMGFESLGHSCQFGLVQRRHGAEPIGLLRWNSIDSNRLIEALEARFAGIDEPDNLVFSVIRREYILRDKTYWTVMHTFINEGGADCDRLLEQQIRRMGFLRRKLLADLESQEKIFVHLEDEPLPDHDVERLRQAFQAYGNGRLLYVRRSAQPSQAGTIEDGGEGMLIGYIEPREPTIDGNWNIDFDSWLKICRASLGFWRDGVAL